MCVFYTFSHNIYMLFSLIDMQQGHAHPYYIPVIRHTIQRFLLHTNEPLSCCQSYTHLLISLSRTHTCNHFLRLFTEYLIIHISNCSTNTISSNCVL